MAGSGNSKPITRYVQLLYGNTDIKLIPDYLFCLQYDPRNSTTSIDVHRNFSINYVDGSSNSGPVYLDTVAIGNLVAENQALAAVTEASGSSGNPAEAVWS